MPGRDLAKPRDAGDRGGLKACGGKMKSAKQAKCGGKSGFVCWAYSSSRLEFQGASLRGKASAARSPRLSSACPRARQPTSHPTLGVQQNFRSSSHEGLNISSETLLQRSSFAQPDQHFLALVLQSLYHKISM